jgi:hypothetical protein
VALPGFACRCTSSSRLPRANAYVQNFLANFASPKFIKLHNTLFHLGRVMPMRMVLIAAVICGFLQNSKAAETQLPADTRFDTIQVFEGLRLKLDKWTGETSFEKITGVTRTNRDGSTFLKDPKSEWVVFRRGVDGTSPKYKITVTKQSCTLLNANSGEEWALQITDGGAHGKTISWKSTKE